MTEYQRIKNALLDYLILLSKQPYDNHTASTEVRQLLQDLEDINYERYSTLSDN